MTPIMLNINKPKNKKINIHFNGELNIKGVYFFAKNLRKPDFLILSSLFSASFPLQQNTLLGWHLQAPKQSG